MKRYWISSSMENRVMRRNLRIGLIPIDYDWSTIKFTDNINMVLMYIINIRNDYSETIKQGKSEILWNPKHWKFWIC